MARIKASLLACSLLACVALGAAGCTKTSFGGKKKTSQGEPIADPSATPGKKGDPSPNEKDGLGKIKPTNPIVECSGNYRGVRMAIVIDTSHSMGPSVCASQQGQTPQQQAAQELEGSDPARIGTSIRGKSDCFTDRQNAAWHIVTRTTERDIAGEKANKTFMGSSVGIAHFPAGTSQALSETYAKISGEPPLKAHMTSLTGVTYDYSFKETLWASLARTHTLTGITPYQAALAAGRDLLKTGRDPNDPRRDVLFVVTDGLPTDQRPSQVVTLRSEIKDVDVVYLYMFDPNVDEAARQKKAKETLQTEFNKGWARQSGNTDGYGPGDFEKYWADLIALPAKIATTRIDVTKPSDLVPKIDAVLDAVQSCK